ncbi:chemotaxis protein CheW [Ureibacillus thermosphaericus]|uniref:Chemotaxis protein CheA n=1 Tax=Ureibacillus thermosphaericus TaxID=51173 RepID=A0A840PMN2_URETH|nr:chemotaxis protein CheW [Ureibacillus thermosphaericus]MBB5149675.1 two-component system chemotaxis sensor kinase CheA [Ureibacillus thermosphaericus]NKZ32470.1 chemotaxis protein CheA [Ureibacillus thermosphaericus]
MAEFDVSNYLGVFLDEVDEQLQILDAEILRLEKEPNNIKTIENIFRAAHTLKGSSASMGFEKMKEFTHHLENVFDQIRHRKIQVTPTLINVILDCIDLIRLMKESIIEGTLDEMDIQPFIEHLEAFHVDSNIHKTKAELVQQSMEYVLDDYQKNVLLNGFTLGHLAYEIEIHLLKDSLMKSVRAFLIQNTISEMGEIIASFPSVEVMESEEEFHGKMVFIVLTKRTREELLECINHLSEIEQVTIKEISKSTLFNETSIQKESLEVETTEANQNENANQQKRKIATTVRVDVDRLEYLMNLVGELVIDQTRLVDVCGRFLQMGMSTEHEFEILDDVTNHLSRVISELQEGMMKTRMLPIEQLFNRFPRMVRDTARQAGKEIDFVMEGKETELDRTLIEEISDPIIHLLRNAIDHGIESPEERKKLGKPASGRVVLRAFHEENHIVISITDDGRGIDPEKIKKASIEKGIISEDDARKLNDEDAMFLIFKSGFSTAKKVTDISGRGVGMDIVKTHIEKLNGVIDIQSIIGEGTTFTIKLPLTLAIIRSLLVKFGTKTFAVPLVNVLEIIRLNKSDIQIVNGQEVGVIRGRVLPLVRMKERLGLGEENENEKDKKREFVVVVGIAEKRVGIIADKMIGNQEIVIKSLGSYIGSPPFISGATIMGDGSIALILDVSSVVRDNGTLIQEQKDELSKTELNDEKQFVTFKLDSEEYGIEIQKVKDIILPPPITKVVEAPDDVLGLMDLRGKMLPVIDLRKRFNLPDVQKGKKSRVIVLEAGEEDIGILVDEVTQVLKISETSIEHPQKKQYSNLSSLIKGISKVKERIVLILAFEELLKSLK